MTLNGVKYHNQLLYAIVVVIQKVCHGNYCMTNWWWYRGRSLLEKTAKWKVCKATAEVNSRKMKIMTGYSKTESRFCRIFRKWAETLEFVCKRCQKWVHKGSCMKMSTIIWYCGYLPLSLSVHVWPDTPSLLWTSMVIIIFVHYIRLQTPMAHKT